MNDINELNINNGFYNNLTIDSILIVERLHNKNGSQYFIANSFDYESISSSFIAGIKNILLLHSTFDCELHFPFYIYYSCSFEAKYNAYLYSFNASDSNDAYDILNNSKYKIL